MSDRYDREVHDHVIVETREDSSGLVGTIAVLIAIAVLGVVLWLAFTGNGAAESEDDRGGITVPTTILPDEGLRSRDLVAPSSSRQGFVHSLVARLIPTNRCSPVGVSVDFPRPAAIE
jgi:hypothetical protein